MSARIGGPPTNTLLHHGIRGGPSSTSSCVDDKDCEAGSAGTVPASRAIHRAVSPDHVVLLCGEDGGIDVLAEDRTYALPAEALRPLLFFGNRVRLAVNGTETDRAVAWPGSDRRWIYFILNGAAYIIGRSRLVAVARGDIPADMLVRQEAS